jgi:DNA-binding protein Fis
MSSESEPQNVDKRHLNKRETALQNLINPVTGLHVGIKVTDDEIAEQLERSLGNITHAARALGVHGATIRGRLKKVPRLAAIAAEVRERTVDTAELQLTQAVNKGEKWAIELVLRTLGKNRGYVERVENETKALTAHINIDWNALSEDELARIIAGEHPSDVLAARSR